MARALSAAEEAARTKYDGMTRRQYNATKGRHAKRQPQSQSGSFEIAALFEGNPAPQTAPFPTMEAALSRFERLSSNPALRVLKLIETKIIRDEKGDAVSMKQVVHLSLTKTGQVFANSQVETLYRRKGGNETLTQKAIKKSPALLAAYALNQLEVVSQIAVGGQAWWERRQ